MDQHSISERTACSLVGLSRAAYRYMPLPKDDEEPLRAEVIRMASTYGRYGYRFIAGMMRNSKIEYLKLGAIGSALSIVSRLLITYLVLILIPLEPIQKGALILFAGLPPAVFNYMIADRYKQEPDKVASIVIVGHLLSLLALPLVLWLAL